MWWRGGSWWPDDQVPSYRLCLPRTWFSFGSASILLAFVFALVLAKARLKDYRMIPFNLKVLAKFGISSNWSQKLDERVLARANGKILTARMLGLADIRS